MPPVRPSGPSLFQLDRLLTRVEKPTRYLGGEWNSIQKEEAEVRLALAFPDLYEIGMSHLGFRILYALLNQLEGVAAERVFMPWTDMLALLREEGLPLVSLESRRPLSQFDLIGFSLQYELTLTNLLAMLDLGGVPLCSEERGENDPLVLAGGPVVFNPEPFAPFVDLVLAGDAEEALPELIALYRDKKRSGGSRREFLRAAGQLPGWYAPGLYDVTPAPETGMLLPRPRRGEPVPERVSRRVLFDLERFPFPESIVVPHAGIVHDRVSWEIMRGCPVGCRFCQAGFVYRPTRERDPAGVFSGVQRSLDLTGYDEFSLASLNTGEYGAIRPLMRALMDQVSPQKIAAGLSSLHASTLSEDLVEQIKRVRKTGFTIAPEAGSQRLRDAINKNLREEDILQATGLAFRSGWQLLKLYFMIGLPTETDADVEAIVDLAGGILKQGREIGGHRVRVTLSASTFVPKPFTPFQWFGMNSEEQFRAKQERIRRAVPPGVEFRGHPHASSWLEGVFSRADRSFARAILEAYRRGAVFDGWSEHLNPALWKQVFAGLGLDAETWATRPLPLRAEFPWEVIDSLIHRDWLEDNYRAAQEARPLATCGEACTGCAAFAGECLQGVVAERRWTDLGSPLSSSGPSVDLPPSPEPQDEVVVPHYRYRGRFSKTGRARFLGHLDLVRAISLGLHRAGIPLAYTQGFKPHPRMSLSPALSLGVASRAEYLDFATTLPLDPEDFPRRVNAVLPEGLCFDALVPAEDRAPSLQETINRATYRARLASTPKPGLDGAVASFLAQESFEIVRARKGKQKRFDLRPLVSEMRVEDEKTLVFTLVLDALGSPRLSEVLEAVAGREGIQGAEIERLDMWTQAGDKPVHPLVAARLPQSRMS